ncbi:hypothetical protein GF357_03790 [Candidatus Dojkabacteria bacterium]|nr:hypothetical protein [Candidatus Dojkabacteria bacterium]
MAANSEISKRTQNEFSWNDLISKRIKAERVEFLCVPENCDSGFYRPDNFYLITKFYDYPTLSTRKAFSETFVKDYLNEIVKINLFFDRQKDINLLRDKDRLPLPEDWDKYQEKILNWMQASSDWIDLSPAYEIVKSYKEFFVAGLNHGDFVP